MKNKLILVAEDDKALSRILTLKLENEGYEVILALDGQEALNLIKERKPNLVLLDLIMPVKNGFEVLEELQKEKTNTPIIVLSNLGQEEDIKKSKDLGAKDYFIKSEIDLSAVVEKINTFLKT